MGCIEVWIEPIFSGTQWCRKMMKGLRCGAKAHHLHAAFLEMNEPHPGSYDGVILAGETLQWYEKMMAYCKGRHVRFCIASNTLFTETEASFIRCDYRQIAENMVRYLYSAGRRRIAMFGVNPSSPPDIARSNGYRDGIRTMGGTVSAQDVFTTAGNIAPVGEAFLSVCNRYDAVLCANDLYAVYLLQLLQRAGLRVPEDLFLCSFGCTALSGLTCPTLTTVSVDLYTIGYQAAVCMDLLVQDGNISTLTLSIRPEYRLGGSTAYVPFPDFTAGVPISGASGMVYSGADDRISSLSRLEDCLAGADETDRRLLAELVSGGRTKAAVAEALFISESTLNYRTEKLAGKLGCRSRSELTALLREYAQFMDFSRLTTAER